MAWALPSMHPGTMDQILTSPLLVVGLIAIGIYFLSCYVHPYMKCPKCNRSKESHSKMFAGAFGMCRYCQGRGHTIRFGARLLGRK